MNPTCLPGTLMYFLVYLAIPVPGEEMGLFVSTSWGFSFSKSHTTAHVKQRALPVWRVGPERPGFRSNSTDS